MLMFCTLSHPDGTTNEYRSTTCAVHTGSQRTLLVLRSKRRWQLRHVGPTWGSGRGGDAQSMWWMECETAGMLTADRVEQYTRPAPATTLVSVAHEIMQQKRPRLL
eukprot:823302-Rhodomonas_salina.2